MVLKPTEPERNAGGVPARPVPHAGRPRGAAGGGGVRGCRSEQQSGLQRRARSTPVSTSGSPTTASTIASDAGSGRPATGRCRSPSTAEHGARPRSAHVADGPLPLPGRGAPTRGFVAPEIVAGPLTRDGDLLGQPAVRVDVAAGLGEDIQVPRAAAVLGPKSWTDATTSPRHAVPGLRGPARAETRPAARWRSSLEREVPPASSPGSRAPGRSAPNTPRVRSRHPRPRSVLGGVPRDRASWWSATPSS